MAKLINQIWKCEWFTQYKDEMGPVQEGMENEKFKVFEEFT